MDNSGQSNKKLRKYLTLSNDFEGLGFNSRELEGLGCSLALRLSTFPFGYKLTTQVVSQVLLLC